MASKALPLSWILNNKYPVWLLLALPAIPLLPDFFFDERYYAELMYDSGVFSVQLLVFNLALTPLRLLTKGVSKLSTLILWLYRQRRYIGVASFCYALIHTLFYLRRTADIADVFDQLKTPEITTGWIALLIMLALAITSNDYAVIKLGRRWKTLHRWIYLATALIALHWVLFGFFTNVLLWCFIPMLLFQTWVVNRRLRV